MKIKDTDKINVATLNGYMKRISRFYNFCFASQYTTINPCLFITKDKSQVSDREGREAFIKNKRFGNKLLNFPIYFSMIEIL